MLACILVTNELYFSSTEGGGLTVQPTDRAKRGPVGRCAPPLETRAFFFSFFSCSGGWVKVKLKLPHFHVSDTCRVNPRSRCNSRAVCEALSNGTPQVYDNFSSSETVKPKSKRKNFCSWNELTPNRDSCFVCLVLYFCPDARSRQT